MSNELLAKRLREIAMELQYHQSGIWGVETVGPLVKAAEALAAHEALAAVPVEPSALQDMEARKDAAYLERNQVVAALAKCFPSGVARTAIEGWSEDWHGCVYIDLPTGQASWHFHDSQAYLFDGLPPYAGVWDGHDTPEKYRRIAALAHPAPQPQQAGVMCANEARGPKCGRWCGSELCKATPPQPTAPAPQAQAQPITEAEAIKLWHGDKEAHRRESAFEWYAAGLIAAQHHYGIAPPASAAQKEPT